MFIRLFLVVFLLHFLFVPRGRLSRLSVSFSLHVKYTQYPIGDKCCYIPPAEATIRPL